MSFLLYSIGQGVRVQLQGEGAHLTFWAALPEEVPTVGMSFPSRFSSN